MKKVLHVIKTKKLESDGRLLKWINALSRYNIGSEVLILEDKCTEANLFIDATIRRLSLKSRKIFSQRKGYFFKIPEYSIICLNQIYKTKSEIILFHDVQQYLNILIFCLFFRKYLKKKILWDLHELPHDILLNFRITKKVLKYLLETVDCVIYTNEERRLYLTRKLNQQEKRTIVLNNYPDENFITGIFSPLPENINVWLDGMPYVLWMGIASKARNFQSFINVYEKYKDSFKVIIMGSVAPEFDGIVKSYIKSNHIYTIFVSQSEIQRFVDNALFSVVLYSDDSPNNFYCEPNRLYQLITRKIPVIVGNNPTMKSLVKRLNAGIVLSDDGKDTLSLDLAIENMLIKISEFKSSLNKVDLTFLSWEKQFKEIHVF